MPTVYLKDVGGDVLLVGGKVALSASCCCCAALNQPTSVTIEGNISGDYPTSAECNSEIDYPFDVDLEVGSDTIVCELAEAESDPFFLEYSCLNSDCDDSALFQLRCSFAWNGLTWDLSIHAEVFTICNPGGTPAAGDDLLVMDVGDDPTGIHHFTFDDPVYPGIHYDITINVA